MGHDNETGGEKGGGVGVKTKVFITVGLLVVFVLGFISGAVAVGLLVRPLAEFARGDTARMEQIVSKRGVKRLKLDAEQADKFRALVAEAGAEIRQVQQEAGARVRTMLEEKYDPKLREFLREDQVAEWERWVEEMERNEERKQKKANANANANAKAAAAD